MDLRYLHREHVGELSRDIAAALEKTGFSALAVHSGAPLKRTDADDQYWPLRPTPHFQHWLPLAEPGCLLLVVPGRKPVLFRPPVQSYWEAPPPPQGDHFWASFEVVETVPPLPPGRVAFVGDEAGAAAELKIADVNPPAVVRALDRLRAHKTAYEVECLAEANRRAALGHEELRRLFQGADRSELELHLAFLGSTRQDDAEAPYKNIVALGKHAATLHHVSYAKRALPAQYLGHCSAAGLYHRAGAVLHRGAAGAIAQLAGHRLEAGRRSLPLRRHPHRGRRGRAGPGHPQPDPRSPAGGRRDRLRIKREWLPGLRRRRRRACRAPRPP